MSQFQINYYIFRNLGSCTGSIITKNIILTAAHCAEHLEKANPLLSYSEVTIGHSNYSSEFAIKIGVKSILKHPNYIYVEEKTNSTNFEEYDRYDKEATFTYDNDIALWKLSKDLEFNDKVQPIALPSANHSDTFLTETQLLFAGWGRAENNINETIIKESERLFEIWNKNKTDAFKIGDYIQHRYDNAIGPENMKMTAMKYHKMKSCVNTKQKLNDERISLLVCAAAYKLDGKFFFTFTKGALPLHLSTVYFSHLSYIQDQLRKCIQISKPVIVISSCCR